MATTTPDSDLSEFGRRVVASRKDHSWTQEQLAERADLHWTYIGQVERGQRNLTLRNIIKLARALDLDPGELVRGLGSSGS